MPSGPLAAKVQELEGQVQQARGQRDLLTRQIVETEVAITRDEAEAVLSERAGQLLRHLGEHQRTAIKQLIEPLCTDAMRDIFGPEAEFQLNFTQTESGRYKATIMTRAGDFLGPPKDTDGGSVCEILSVVLRIAFLMIHYPRLSPVLVMDEPLGNLDEEKVPTFGAFLQQVCHNLQERGVGMQVLASVHMLAGALAPYADRSWQVTMTEQGSTVMEGDVADGQ